MGQHKITRKYSYTKMMADVGHEPEKIPDNGGGGGSEPDPPVDKPQDGGPFFSKQTIEITEENDE